MRSTANRSAVWNPPPPSAEPPLGKGALLSTQQQNGHIRWDVSVFQFSKSRNYFASETATAQATVIPTMGLLPAPIRPIIST